MHLYCLAAFKEAVEKLNKSKAHATLEKTIVDYYHGKTIQEVASGVNLNNSDTTPYLKKRLEGSGGYRVYSLLLIKEECAYLLFVHAKTGPGGSENITDAAKKEFYKQINICILADKGLFSVECDAVKGRLLFSTKPKDLPIEALAK